MIEAIQNRRSLFIFIILVCILTTPIVRAQQVNISPSIHLKSGTIAPSANAREWLTSNAALPVAKDPSHVLIHFYSLPTSEQREQLLENGITLLDYIPDNTFSAHVLPGVSSERLSSLPIHSITNIRPEWKADDYLWKKVNSQSGAVEVLVSFYPNIDAAKIRQYIAGIGGRFDNGPWEKYGSYKVIIAANSVQTVAQWYGVRYISPVTSAVPLDVESLPAVKGNLSSFATSGSYGLLGDSVTVGVGDDASGIYHIDIKDRITNFNPGPQSHHGEFVNGIVGGAAIVDPIAASMAPHVALLDYLYDLILPATGAMYRDYNMTITNNSYEVIAGDCGYAGTYDIYSQLLDTLSVQYPYVLHVFASGNDGYNTCLPYPESYATVGGGYQPAKNNIVVGNMTCFFTPSPDESRGPVKDGRLKPEIIAVGLLVYSTIGTDQYEWAAGTSMSCPQVAGGLAELTQRYKQLNGGAQPRADVLKTILLDGAMDLGTPGPDYTYGFGAMDMYRSLQILDNKRYTLNALNDGETKSFTITVPPNTAQLKVMLNWNDVPASPTASKALVNDLDLTVNDPALKTHLPLVLNADPGHVTDPATEQADHLNNVEQVIINSPAAGTYTINTTGFSVPYGPQAYVIAYDIIPVDMQLTFPVGGEHLCNADTTKLDSIRIYWNAITDGNAFTVQISQNNGATWTTLSNNVPADVRYFPFEPTGFNSGDCLVRIMRNNTTQVATSQRFTINAQTTANLDTAQCPGYVNIHWTPVPGASSYYLLNKKGYYMQVVDSTTATSYSFSGMSLTDNSYVAVQPVLDGFPGYRSIAVVTLANSGSCTNPASKGDLMIEKIVSPSNGRMYTSTQFGATTPVQVKVRDLYTSACSNYTLACQVNGGSWQTITNPGTIPANGTAVISIPGISFADTGAYTIRVAINNLDLTDPQHANDSVAFTVLNLPNDSIDLTTPFIDGFEAMGKITIGADSVGVTPNGHWDYFHTSDTGRMRTYISDELVISGNRSVSLDENQATGTATKNTFVGTFNLGKYDTANTEIRVDFDYILHGTPKSAAGNVVTARANDTLAWTPLFTYDLTAYPGNVTNVRSRSLTDILRQSNHNFSSSCQVSFGQSDTSLIASTNYGNGITIDNFKMYTVVNDAQLVSVVSPAPANCGLPASVPLTVQVHNGVSNTLHAIQMYYSMDGGQTYAGIIDSIKGKSDVKFTFSQELAITPGSTHSLTVWLKEPGDSYTGNDTILNYQIRNSQIITSFPYLENFESGDGGYYTGGFKNSWQYGTPASPKINRAASGTKAWKTNLTGNYNNLEKSYLYSPCFDISQMTAPMLSFSIASDIENCGGTLCDAGYVEYSFDGASWRKLGAYGQGTNWYDSTFDVWNTEGFTRWHVATIALPELGSGQTTHFRFVMAADPGATFEGMAIDDIHIYDLANPIAPATGINTIKLDASANQWNDYLLNNQLLASLQPTSQSIPNTSATLYAHDTLYNPNATQYTFPRSYTVNASPDVSGNTSVRLYLLDSDVVHILKDTTCPSCTRVTDAYSLGITKYDDPQNRLQENGSLADDTSGVFTYYPYQSLKWVPYDKGYYVEFNTSSFSEFWFNNGGPTGNFPAAGPDYLNFIAFKDGSDVATYWYSLIDQEVDSYQVQRSYDSVAFVTVSDTASKHLNPGEYSFKDAVSISADSPVYYRLRWTMTGKKGYNYSPVRKISNTDSGASLVTMDAQMIAHDQVLVNWISYIDPATNHYKLERAIGNEAYVNISNTNATHTYGQRYSFTDILKENIAMGTPVHYRLTAILDDGNNVVLPVRTVNWISDNTVVNAYPNPNYDGSFTIAWNADPGTVMNVNIRDVLGRSMYQANVIATQWANNTTLQTFSGPKGVYDVHIIIGGKSHAIKMVYY